ACGNDEAVEALDRPGGRLGDVDDALVGAHLELLAALLVDVRAAQNGVPLDPRGERDGTADAGVAAPGPLPDLPAGCIQRPVVVGLHSNANPVARHRCLPSCAWCPFVDSRSVDTKCPALSGASRKEYASPTHSQHPSNLFSRALSPHPLPHRPRPAEPRAVPAKTNALPPQYPRPDPPRTCRPRTASRTAG